MAAPPELTKRLEKKLNENCRRVLRAVLKKSWKQYATMQKLLDHLSPISQTINVIRTRHARHSGDVGTNKLAMWASTYEHTCVGQANAYIHQLCADIGWRLEDLPRTL